MAKTLTLNIYGLDVLVDTDMAQTLGEFNWYINQRGYAYTAFYDRVVHRTRTRMMHHLVVGKPPIGMFVDHGNRNKLDNRRCNLRICTRRENQRNHGVSSVNTSGYKGVSYQPSRRRFLATIRIDGIKTNLGRFETAERAAREYDAAAMEHFGEFAFLNFPLPPTEEK